MMSDFTKTDNFLEKMTKIPLIFTSVTYFHTLDLM